MLVKARKWSPPAEQVGSTAARPGSGRAAVEVWSALGGPGSVELVDGGLRRGAEGGQRGVLQVAHLTPADEGDGAAVAADGEQVDVGDADLRVGGVQAVDPGALLDGELAVRGADGLQARVLLLQQGAAAGEGPRRVSTSFTASASVRATVVTWTPLVSSSVLNSR